MTMYYLGIFLISHLIAGVFALIIEFLFFRDKVLDFIEDLNQKLDVPVTVNRKMYNTLTVIVGWASLIETLKSIYDYFSDPDFKYK